MKKFFALLTAVALVSVASLAQAVTISVFNPLGDNPPALPLGSTGSLEVRVLTSPENLTFTNGGIEMKVTSTVPGVLQFTSATVANPTVFGFSPRWSVAQAVDVGDDTIGLLQGASVSTPALTTGDPTNTIGENLFLYATLNYTVTGDGATDIVLEGFDGLNDFISSGNQVVPTLVAGRVVGGVPEPATLAMAGMSLVGLVLRRRNG